MKMKLIALAVLIVLMLGCDPRRYEPEGTVIHVQGYVRNIWYREGWFYVVFEHDTGTSQTMEFITQPPVWSGEHVRMEITTRHKYSHGPDMIYEAVKTERIP